MYEIFVVTFETVTMDLDKKDANNVLFYSAAASKNNLSDCYAGKFAPNTEKSPPLPPAPV